MARGTGSSNRHMLGDSCLFPSSRRVYSSSASDLTPISDSRLNESGHLVYGEQQYERVMDDALGPVSGGLQQGLGPVSGGLQQGLGPVSGGLQQGLGPVSGGLQQGLGPVSGGLQQGLGPVSGGLQQGLGPVSGGLQQGLGPVSGGLQQGLGPVSGGLQQGLDPTSRGLQQGLDPISGGLQQGLDPLSRGLHERLGPIAGGLQQRLEPISAGLQQGLDPTSRGLQQGLGPIAGGLQQGLDPISAGLQQGLGPTSGGLQQKLGSTEGNLTQRLDALEGLQYDLHQFGVGFEEEQGLVEGQMIGDIERGSNSIDKYYKPQLGHLREQLDFGQSTECKEERKLIGYRPTSNSEGGQEHLYGDDSYDITSVDSATFSTSPDIYKSPDHVAPQTHHLDGKIGNGVETDSGEMTKSYLLSHGGSGGPRSPDSGLPSESDQGRTYVSVVEGLCTGGQVLFYHKQVGTCTVPLTPLQNLRTERSEFEIHLLTTHQERSKDGLFPDRRLVTEDDGHEKTCLSSPLSYGLMPKTASRQTAPILMAVGERMLTAGDRSADWIDHVGTDRSSDVQEDRQTVATYGTEGNLDMEVETIMSNRELFSFKAKEISDLLEKRMLQGLENITELVEAGPWDNTQGATTDPAQDLRVRLQTEIESFSYKIASLSTTTRTSDQKVVLFTQTLTNMKLQKQELDETQEGLEVTDRLEDLTRQLESEVAQKTYLQQKLEETASLLEAQRQDLDEQATTITDLQAHRRHLEERVATIMQWAGVVTPFIESE